MMPRDAVSRDAAAAPSRAGRSTDEGDPVRATVSGEVLERWPHIARFLRVGASGRVEVVLPRWCSARLGADEEAAAYEEWAEFYEWQLRERDGALAGDPLKRHLVAVWTDSMVYLSRRLAASARGEDPGEWVPQYRRRPDLDAEAREIVGSEG